jgi:phenylacetate-coenzyme A ligase PaaK-like adenylate-forming protein
VPRGEERRTGGSTGEPVALSVSPAEIRRAEAALWYARGWFGIRPSSRLFLLWGHAHVLGEGIRGRIYGSLRGWKDALLGYRRHSAYDMSPAALRAAGDALLAHRPGWVLGYSTALDRFAALNADRGDALRALRLRAAVATAEAFPRPDSRGEIAALLGCPVVMEYGSVETGPIAHEGPDGSWRCFWREFLVELDDEGGDGEARDILVTCLHPRRLPLVRYRIGDLAEGAALSGPPGREIERLRGRANDVVVLEDGSRVHSELVAHALRAAPSVRCFQVVRTRRGGARIEVVADGGLPEAESAAVRGRLARAHPALARVPLLVVRELRTSAAGKLVRVVDEPPDAALDT